MAVLNHLYPSFNADDVTGNVRLRVCQTVSANVEYRNTGGLKATEITFA